MANALYDIAVNMTFTKQIDWSAGTNFKLVALNSGYTFSSAHQHLSDISGGDIELSGVVIGGCTFTARTFKFSGVILSGITSGHTVTAVAVYIDTGTPSTSTLLAFIDTASTLPVTSTGADINFTPDGTLGLFST